jgi:hypothetical protein
MLKRIAVPRAARGGHFGSLVDISQDQLVCGTRRPTAPNPPYVFNVARQLGDGHH